MEPLLMMSIEDRRMHLSRCEGDADICKDEFWPDGDHSEGGMLILRYPLRIARTTHW